MCIIGKAAAREEQLRGKARISKYIELQLFNEFDNLKGDVDSVFDIITSVEDVDVRIVHSPLVSGDDVNIEYLGNEEDRFKLTKTVELAAKLADYYNHGIKVIIHTAFLFEQYKKMPNLLNAIEDFISSGLKNHKGIVFCIENVHPCNISPSGDIYFRNGVFYDNIKLVKYLREKLNTTRIGTVLDTCHVLVTLRILEKVFGETYAERIKDINMQKFFVENRDYCEVLHLCDVKDLGFENGEHGVKFENDRLGELEEILSYYKKYMPQADITLEILEEDYVENKNFEDNFNLVRQMLEV